MKLPTLGILKSESSSVEGKSLLGCILRARELGYEVVASDNLELLDASQLSGLIYLQRRDIDTPLLKRLEKNGLPVVACNTTFPDISSVAPDNFGGMRSAIEHLNSLGHKRIAFVRGPLGVRNAEERLEAFRLSLDSCGLDFDASLVINGESDFYPARNAIYNLLAARRDFTAIICSNDKASIGAICAIRQSGLKAPEDIAVIGFSNFAEILSMTDDRISCVDYPTYQIGIKATEILHQKISGEKNLPIETRVPCPLLIKDTCGGSLLKIPKSKRFSNEQDRLLGYLFSVGNNLAEDYILELIELFHQKIDQGEHPIHALRSIFISGINNGLDPMTFHQLLIYAGNNFEHWSTQSKSQPTTAQVLDALQHFCRDNIMFYSRQAVDIDRRFTEITESVFNLNIDISETNHIAVILQQLQSKLNVRSINLLLFEHTAVSIGSASGNATLWQSGASIANKEQQIKFNARTFQYDDILPGSRSYRSTAAYTLRNQEGINGILFIDTDSDYLHLYHKIGPLLSAHLQRVSLFRSLQRQTNLLEDQKRELQEANENAELAKTKEADSRHLAEKANDAKSEFLTVMSHEIRTPLNCIIGMSDIATLADSTQDANECIRIVKDSANSLLEIVNDLLDFSKIETGQLKLRYANFNIHYEIGSVIDLLKPQATNKNLSLEKRFDSEIPETTAGDPIRLKQILTNLIDNAIRFTEQGGITVTTSFETQDPHNPQIKIDISDTGPGISEEVRKKIFDTFQFAHTSDQQLYGSVGLGLAIVSRLVKQMKGSITLESNPGEGSVFTVRLPIENIIVNKEASNSNRSSELDTSSDENQFQKQRILLVDDNASNLLVAQTMLEREGHLITKAFSGQQAINLWRHGSFDLIFMDVQMPGKDGWQTTQEIRKAEEQSGTRTPIIALTSHAIEGYDQKCYAAGMDAYITKPVERKALIKFVQEASRKFRNPSQAT